MEGLDLNTIGITLMTVLGSAGAWKFWQRRLEAQITKEQQELKDKTLFRDDLRERVAVLESKLEEERQNAMLVSQKIIELKELVTEYKVRLEFLEKENQRLRAKAGEI